MRSRPGPDVVLDDPDGRSLRALGALLGLELDVRALGQRLEAVATDRAEMNENVLPAVSRRDEPEALGVVEPLHGSGCHRNTPPHTQSKNGQRRRRTRNRHSLEVPPSVAAGRPQMPSPGPDSPSTRSASSMSATIRARQINP